MPHTDDATEGATVRPALRRSLTHEASRALRHLPGVGPEPALIGLSLTRAAHAHSTASELLVHRRHDRSWLIFNVLYVVWAFEPVTARDIVEWSGLSRQTVSNILRALEDKSIVTRTRDAEDARLITIRLTDEGRASHEQSLAEQFELDSAIFDGLTAEERSQLISLLDRVRRQVQALEQQPDAAGQPAASR
jgi:DNA-binding MarR family transcriptional regulator